ncbi:hypothetical protein R3I93_016864 [Phoxinus phoxinus]|uniref:Immunoglobulin I-set domain-containing protein n=1 Tax=Phoxinus phoxinus TaxID=58324 RepID=A0AAN9CJQ0_9TELE
MNISITDSGEYKLVIINNTDNSNGGASVKIFKVSVHGVCAAERDEMKRKSVKEGESVTLETPVEKHPNYLMKWYFNGILVAEITGDQSKICTDVQCKQRFRDRLKLDHQTGSLTITHTTNTHSGEYTLRISDSRFSIIRSFCVCVTAWNRLQLPAHREL